MENRTILFNHFVLNIFIVNLINMKKLFGLILILSAIISISAQNKLHIGLGGSNKLTWFNTDEKDVRTDGIKYGGGNNTYNYSLSKHTSEFIPNVYRDWAKKNVYINNLRIGVTNTKIHKNILNKNIKSRIKLIPAGRMAQPYEISKLIYYLSSTENTFCTGETFNISGGE